MEWMREGQQYKAFSLSSIDTIAQLGKLDAERLEAMRAVAMVLPFRVSNHVVDRLIDWDAAPDDPIFQLTFPQPEMLDAADRGALLTLLRNGASRERLAQEADRIRSGLNPHPAGQLELNVPRLQGKPLRGIQHKYRETVLFFPAQGQTCHAYCTYCFRWPQFVGPKELRFGDADAAQLASYVASKPAVQSVLITGGDPMVMRASVLARYIEPLLAIEHLRSIRIGTKALSYWPRRFLSDSDADALMRLFERVVASGKSLAFMAHFSHPREVQDDLTRRAIRRIRSTGAVIRSQAPLIRHVNDDAAAWGQMWRAQISLGVVPYYMFVERDTGPKAYFRVPLHRALEIFSGGFREVSGLARTVRGPSMSATLGKVLVEGIAEVEGERLFVLKFLQARDPRWVNRIFFARYDEQAYWLDDLRPAFGREAFFFETPDAASAGHGARDGRPTRSSIDFAAE